MNIKLLPEKYVLKRWTHETRDGVVHDRNGTVVENSKLDVTRQNRELCRKFTKITAKTAGFEESSAFVDGVLNDLEIQVDQMMIPVPNTSDDHLDNLSQKAFSLKKRDGKKGGKRHKSWVENLTKKKTNTTNDKRSKKANISAYTMPLTLSMQVEASNSVCNSNATISNSVFILPSNHIEDDAFSYVTKNADFKENTDPYFSNITLTPF